MAPARHFVGKWSRALRVYPTYNAREEKFYFGGFMNENNAAELRLLYTRAEEAHQSAYRRAQWLERRLINAPTEEQFREIEKELQEQEKELRSLALEATRRRLDYVASLS